MKYNIKEVTKDVYLLSKLILKIHALQNPHAVFYETVFRQWNNRYFICTRKIQVPSHWYAHNDY